MNQKIIKLFKHFSLTLTSNLISLIIASITVLIAPKIIGVKEYGYWQLYLFYASYVGFMQFGWNDGMYLRYVGKDYDELDKKTFQSQFYMLTISQVVISTLIASYAIFLVDGMDRKYIYIMLALCISICGVRAMPLFLLQATNRFEDYAKITVLDRCLYCGVFIVFIFFGFKDFKLMIFADILGKLISLIYSMFRCKEIVFLKSARLFFDFQEAFKNITAGIKLMFANIASMLIIGIVRFGIINTWSVSVFGKVSLTLNISNLMMIFIDSLGIVILPILKRINQSKLPNIYSTLREILMLLFLGALIFYYPIKLIMTLWIPQYEDSLLYMALIFPLCIFEGKIALLINTYLKALRKENIMFKINIISVFLSLFITLINALIIKNLIFTIISIIILFAFRCVIAEVYLSKFISISIFKSIIIEVLMTLIFVIVSWFIHSWLSTILYTSAFLIYLLIRKKSIFDAVNSLKQLATV